MRIRFVRFVGRAALVLPAVWAGCSGTPDEKPTIAPYSQHIVMFDGGGRPIEPTGNPAPGILPYRVMGDDEYAHHVTDVFDAVGDAFKNGAPHDPDGPVPVSQRKLFVFIHGGLNNQAGSIERARVLAPEMLADGVYPIFINWQSSLVSSYFDHLFFIRQGERGNWAQTLWAPVILLSDAAWTLARAPLSIGRQMHGVWDSLPWTWSDRQSTAHSTAVAALGEFGRWLRNNPDAKDPRETFAIEVEPDRRGFGEQAWSAFTWVLTSPVKVATGVLVEGFGTPAWDTMVRRTHLLFAEEESYSKGGLSLRVSPVSMLFDEAVVRRERWSKRGSVQIQVACHSMGAIVLNELVRRDTRRLLDARARCELCPKCATCGDCDRCEDCKQCASPLFDELIYMAPACSIADLVDSVAPYLSIAPSVRVHVLVLHPRAEVNESNAFDLAPRGSLIDWLDSFLTHPTDARERRAGAFVNLMLALHEFPLDVRGRIQIRTFGYGGIESAWTPEKHGEFTDRRIVRWWRPDFWETWPRGGPNPERREAMSRDADSQAQRVELK